MHDLRTFSLSDMVQCSARLRALSSGAGSMEEVAKRIVQDLYQTLGDTDSRERACVLVRFYKTFPFSGLEPELRERAARVLAVKTPVPDMKCLTLLATAGDQPEWNSRHLSVRHRVIPLASAQMVESFPMISQLIRQFGLEITDVLEPRPQLLLNLEQRTFNVFHVPEALNSPYVPDQKNFVVPFGVKSVLGFGGMLPTGNLFAIIMFSKVPIPHQTAEIFKTLAVSAKVAVLPFAGERVFEGKTVEEGCGAKAILD